MTWRHRPFGESPMRPVSLGFVLVFACVAGSAGAASFDCRKARTADEKAICAERALNDKDVRMNELYGINRRTLAMGTIHSASHAHHRPIADSTTSRARFHSRNGFWRETSPLKIAPLG